jgi:hypothetical protein
VTRTQAVTKLIENILEVAPSMDAVEAAKEIVDMLMALDLLVLTDSASEQAGK